MENTFVFIIVVDTLEQSGIETRAELKSHPTVSQFWGLLDLLACSSITGE